MPTITIAEVSIVMLQALKNGRDTKLRHTRAAFRTPPILIEYSIKAKSETILEYVFFFIYRPHSEIVIGPTLAKKAVITIAHQPHTPSPTQK